MLERGQHYNAKKLAVVAVAVALLAMGISASNIGKGGTGGNVTVYNNYTNNTNASYYNVTSNLTNATVDAWNTNASNLSQPINISVLPFDTCTGSPLQWSWWDGTRLNCYTYSDDDDAYLTIAAYTTDFNNQQTNNSEQENEIATINNSYITNTTMDKNYNNLTNVPINFNNSSIATINQTIRPYSVDYNNLTNVPTNFNNSTVGSKEAIWDAKVNISVDNLTNYYNKSTSDLLYASSALTYYFWNTSASASFPGYTVMNTTLPQTTTMRIESFTSVADGTNIVTRINENTNITTIESGLWSQHTHVNITSEVELVHLQMRSAIYLNGSGFSDVLLSSSTISNIVPNDGMMHDTIWFGQFQQKVFMNVTDKLVMRLYAVVTGTGANPSFEIHVEGTTGASIILPINQQSIFVSANDTVARENALIANTTANNANATANNAEPAIAGSTGNTFWNGLKNWIALSTSNVTEGINLFFTPTRVRSNISNGTSGNLTYNSTNGSYDLSFGICTGNNYYQSANGRNITCAAGGAGGITNETVRAWNTSASNLSGIVPAANLGTGGTGTNFLRSDGTWQTPGGGSDPWTYKVLPINASTTSATDTTINASGVYLNFTPSANTNYEFEAKLMISTATATVNPRIGLRWSNGLTFGTASIYESQTATSQLMAFGNPSANLLIVAGGLPLANQAWPVTVSGVIIVGASPTGAMNLTLASETAGTQVRVITGSFLKYRSYS